MNETQVKERRTRHHIYHLEFRAEEVSGNKRNCYGLDVEFVIIAKTDQEARFTAADCVRDEHRHYWLDPRWTSSKEIGDADMEYQTAQIICRVYIGE